MDLSDSTVIIGGGIIGLSTAYYLALAQNRGNNIFIVDISADVVSAASGKSNGVLPDYDFENPIIELAHLSWKLHEKLAQSYNGPMTWGYTKTLRHYLSHRSDKSQDSQPQYKLPGWIRDREKYYDTVRGNPYTCARL